MQVQRFEQVKNTKISGRLDSHCVARPGDGLETQGQGFHTAIRNHDLVTARFAAPVESQSGYLTPQVFTAAGIGIQQATARAAAESPGCR